jgi:hypothetical protein
LKFENINSGAVTMSQINIFLHIKKVLCN